jgi:hypothetical protein
MFLLKIDFREAGRPVFPTGRIKLRRQEKTDGFLKI